MAVVFAVKACRNHAWWEGKLAPPPPHPLQYQWPLGPVGPETHLHKITNVLVSVFYMALGINGFDAGKSITPVIGMVGP